MRFGLAVQRQKNGAQIGVWERDEEKFKYLLEYMVFGWKIETWK